MAAELTVPTLGMDMTEATIVRWLVEEGEEVEKGDPVLEIDTDKTSFEVEASESGEIRNLTGDVGETLPVGALLAHILAPGEEAPGRPARNSEESSEPEESEARKPETSESVESSRVSASSVGDSEKPPQTRKIRASPAARRAAVERGLELSEVYGSGPNGRVYLSDVMNFESLQEKSAPERVEAAENGSRGFDAPEEPEGPEESKKAGVRREPLSQIRRIGAERTQKSFAEVPHFYLRRDLDAEGLVDLRERLKERLEVAPSLNDLISFAVCRTLQSHPRLNSRFDSGELVVNESVNLGVAAATEKGLLVPVVVGAEKLRLADLSSRTKELLKKARDGELARDELSGGTFTISNLGMMGVDSFDAIINQPEAAILAVGRLRTAPEWENGEWVPRRKISVTLSVDHRVADGADGARFLEDLQAAITDWELLM